MTDLFELPPGGETPKKNESKRGPPTPSIGGLIVRFWDYYSPAGKHEPNWTMKCDKCLGGRRGCHKRKGASVETESRHGIIEPLAFLRAWHAMVPRDDQTHASINPTQEDVDRFAVAHADELLAVCRVAGR